MNDRSLWVANVGRNRPAEAIEVLKRREAAGVLRADDIETAIKLQDDGASLRAQIIALGLWANDPNEW